MANIYKSEEGARRIGERYRALLRDWPVPCEHLRLPTCQGETFVIACGDKRSPPLLLLHGSGSNSAVWMRDVATWSAHFRVYAVDVIGEPGLSAPARPPLASDAYARWMDDVIAGLSLRRVRLFGVSLGGWIALDYATRQPQRIDQLVLLCPSGVGRQRLSFLFKAVLLLSLGPLGRRKALAIASGPKAADSARSDYLLLIFKYFKPRMGKIPIFDDDTLKRLVMPVMLVVGGRDALLDSAETLDRMQRLLPNLHGRYLADVGHVITGQTGAVLDFLLGSTQRETGQRSDGILPRSSPRHGPASHG